MIEVSQTPVPELGSGVLQHRLHEIDAKNHSKRWELIDVHPAHRVAHRAVFVQHGNMSVDNLAQSHRRKYTPAYT